MKQTSSNAKIKALNFEKKTRMKRCINRNSNVLIALNQTEKLKRKELSLEAIFPFTQFEFAPKLLNF